VTSTYILISRHDHVLGISGK